MRFAPVFATLLRGLTLTLTLVSSATSQEDQPIPDNELREFLGPVSPDRIEWRVLNSVDFDVYYGKANPPLSGSVGFYLGLHPQELKPRQTTSKSRLGRFPVTWSRTVNADGSIEQQTIIRLDSVLGLKAHVWADAPNETQLDNLLLHVGQLPVFATGAIPDRFKEIHDELAEEQRIRPLVWICWSALVITGAALVDRFCRRRQRSAAFRFLSLGGVLAFAVVATIAGVVLSPPFVMHQYHTVNGFLLMGAAGALCIMALLLGSGLYLLQVFRKRTSPRNLTVP